MEIKLLDRHLGNSGKEERYEDGDEEDQDVDPPDKALPLGTSCHIGCT